MREQGYLVSLSNLDHEPEVKLRRAMGLGQLPMRARMGSGQLLITRPMGSGQLPMRKWRDGCEAPDSGVGLGMALLLTER